MAIRYEKRTGGRRRPYEAEKKTGLNTSTFIMVLVAIGAVLYFLSG